MARTTDGLIRRVREELRVEGPDGGGISDWLIKQALNSAIKDLSEVYQIRDIYEFDTQDGVNEYNLENYADDAPAIHSIIKVEYDNRYLQGGQLRDYLDKAVPKEGQVDTWALWGNSIILVGAVEDDKHVVMWVSRAPHPLVEKDDIPETPPQADEAIIAYACSICNRESKDFDRANYYYRVYTRQKEDLLNRFVPQSRGAIPRMSDNYMKPVKSRSSGWYPKPSRFPKGS